jgi:mannose-6-phosphate isomerase-like protein (cupin superfamily)
MAGPRKINLTDSFQLLTDYFAPKIIGEVNDVYIKIARIKGEKIPWHKHQDEDELFYIVEGSLKFEIEAQDDFTLNEGDIYIVRKGVNHRVSSTEECKIMLIENKTTAHTGDVKSAITRSIDQQKLPG